MKAERHLSTTFEMGIGLVSILCGHALLLTVTKGAAFWFLGFVQLTYALPAGLWAHRRGYRKMPMTIFMAGLTFLLNMLVWIAIFSL